MAIRKFTVTVTTGTATGEGFSPFLSGYIESIQYIKPGADPFADGVDFTITAETTGETIWSELNVNAAVIKHPRAATHSTAGVAATFDGTRPVLDRVALGRDRVKIAVAQGGNGTSGTFVIAVDDAR
ncbi:hypothetical protein [Martelella soudanensis]|uniref:hypothetical protein n=1 Tax=unclassified Martelella TaxID=2629616 RepID=UPI001FEDEB5A|nr:MULTISPECIES: hypothetical protein [unclassified Martelella]